jgi:hypothetical protein
MWNCWEQKRQVRMQHLIRRVQSEVSERVRSETRLHMWAVSYRTASPGPLLQYWFRKILVCNPSRYLLLVVGVSCTMHHITGLRLLSIDGTIILIVLCLGGAGVHCCVRLGVVLTTHLLEHLLALQQRIIFFLQEVRTLPKIWKCEHPIKCSRLCSRHFLKLYDKAPSAS